VSVKRPKRHGNGRYAFLLTLIFFCFAVIAARLVWVQAVVAHEYAARATSQRLRDIELPSRRGTIYDREGEPLAVSVEARTVFASPNQIVETTATAQALAQTLGGDVQEYLEKLHRDTGFVYIARKVDLNRANALEKLDMDGVGFLDDFRRLYPSGELASQVLGFVGVDDNGLAGIESFYDETLKGTPGVVLGERDPRGNPIPGGIQKVIEPVHGHDIALTIDKDIQYEAQVEIAAAVQKWGAKSGSVIIMNPKNGEIYAMATAPGFNSNEYGKAKAAQIRNRPVTDAYEPGSTLKCLTASAVIEKGLYTPSSKLSLPSTIRVGDRTIHESHDRAAVKWTLSQIVTHSSNVGTVKLGLKLGEESLYESFAKFGITEKTGIDFPGEAKGWLPPTDQWSPSSIGNIPFGQGISVTPVQLTRAVAGIANKGEMPTPHFLLEIPNSAEPRASWPLKRAITESTASQVTTMLQAVVTEGTGTEAKVSGYSVAGKTGTAQKAQSGGRGYTGGKYIGSFIGYAPAEDPQVLVCVTIDEPRNSIYGGTVAAPSFSRLTQFALSHLKIPPSSTGGNKPAKKSKETTGVGPVSDVVPRD
jgi:cell division protein FtsI/penicillin-binding protein 2